MKLNQVIATEKSIKNKVHDEVTALHRTLQKSDLFNGHAKKFHPISDDGEKFEDDNKKVQFQAGAIIKAMTQSSIELLDVEAQKDLANTLAKADVKVDGVTILNQVPATTLLFLEKQVLDFRTSIETTPTLDSSESWTKDTNSGLYVTAVQKTHRTKKVQRPIVLYDATEFHPAQTQLISEDVIVGHWETTKQSGALASPEKAALLEKANKLLVALKVAREEANSIKAEKVEVGASLFNYLLA